MPPAWQAMLAARYSSLKKRRMPIQPSFCKVKWLRIKALPKRTPLWGAGGHKNGARLFRFFGFLEFANEPQFRSS